LGRKILGQHPPRSVEEFRATAPFTTYDDYEPNLSEKREEAFGARPLAWMAFFHFCWQRRPPHRSRLAEMGAVVTVLGDAAPTQGR
jgi:hypothetical protein